MHDGAQLRTIGAGSFSYSVPPGRSHMGIRSSRLVIGIAGGSGSGKTTVTQAIISAVGADNVTLLQQDSYYRDFGDLSAEQRLAINWDHPETLENELLVAHVRALRAGAA